MALSAGDRLGPYEIVSLIGEGGMGQVWKARDTRLDRIVAIKTSREQFDHHFEREARAVAALNHPNVCTLYDVGPDYLVMEFVEGPTLADRFSQGALKVEEAVPIARQIAEAMETAHERGIIHRDLKPQNIKLTAQGIVKVLDFGLAKAGEAPRDPASAETIRASASIRATIVGTPAYMSPEQAAGKPLDKRTDIWSYGVVLWEMVTGRQMFEGETISHVMAAVLTQQPEVEAAPGQLRPLLRRCLVKDPNKRMRDIGEARLIFDGEIPTASAPAQRNLLWPISAAALVVAAVIGILVSGPCALWIVRYRFIARMWDEPFLRSAEGRRWRSRRTVHEWSM